MSRFDITILAETILADLESKIPQVRKQFPNMDDRQAMEYIKMLAKYDPTVSKNYLAWIAKQVKNGQIRMPEDGDKVLERLTFFDNNKIKNSWKNKYPNDIYKFDFHTLADAVDDISGLGEEAKSKREKEKINTNIEGAKLVYNKSPYTVYKITDRLAAHEFGKNAEWCTKHLDALHCSVYLAQGPLYVIFKDGKRIAQMHIAQKEATKGDVDTSRWDEEAQEWSDDGDGDYEELDYWEPSDLGTMQLMNLKDRPVSIDKYPGLDKAIIEALGGIEYIKKNPALALWYARDIIGGEWPEGEEAIASVGETAYNYSELTGSRFEEGEAAIASFLNPALIIKYIKKWLRGGFPKAEEQISLDAEASVEYAKLINKRFELGEEALTEGRVYSADEYNYDDYLSGNSKRDLGLDYINAVIIPYYLPIPKNILDIYSRPEDALELLKNLYFEGQNIAGGEDYIDKNANKILEFRISRDSKEAFNYVSSISLGLATGKSYKYNTGTGKLEYSTHGVGERRVKVQYKPGSAKIQIPEIIEDSLASDPYWALQYATKVLGGRFPKGEKAIMEDERFSLSYSKLIDEKYIPEELREKYNTTTVDYYFRNGRLDELLTSLNNDYTSTSEEIAYQTTPRSIYLKAFKENLSQEERDILARDPQYAYRYATDILKGRFIEGESAIAADPKFSHYYVSSILIPIYKKLDIYFSYWDLNIINPSGRLPLPDIETTIYAAFVTGFTDYLFNALNIFKEKSERFPDEEHRKEALQELNSEINIMLNKIPKKKQKEEELWPYLVHTEPSGLNKGFNMNEPEPEYMPEFGIQSESYPPKLLEELPLFKKETPPNGEELLAKIRGIIDLKKISEKFHYKEVSCGRCQGTGKRKLEIKDNGWGNGEYTEPCPYCKGTGKVRIKEYTGG